MKKTIQSIVGSVIILFISFWIFGVFASSKKSPKKSSGKATTQVTVSSIKNTTLPIQINSTGTLVAKDRAILYSEVQGVFEKSSKAFKPGVSYSAGQTLIKISNSEFAASVKSQRVAFKSLVTSTLADIQFDYPAELPKWKSYAKQITPSGFLPKFPEVNNDNFENYITGKNIYSTYYTIKNLETRLSKYSIKAPFSGVLVEANITPGTLVSPGQKLGEFIKPNTYELELNVNASFVDLLKVGKSVTLENIEGNKQYEGKVSRVNSKVDRATQTVSLFVEIRSSELNEGEYLQAIINAQNVEGVTEIERKLIVDQNHVFTYKDSALVKQPVAIIHSNKNTLVIKGLEDGTQLVTVPVPGGYEGMKVSIQQ